MFPDSDLAELSRKLTELRERRRSTQLELKAVRDRQEHVPLSSVPGVRSVLHVLKRLYLLPQIQVWQQAIDQLSLEESDTLALALNTLRSSFNAALSGQSERLDSTLQNLKTLEQTQSGL